MDNQFPVTLVFLDTSIYVDTNFAFSGPLYSALRSRIERGQARLGITRLTIQEAEAQIAKSLAEAEQAVHKARQQAKILRNSDNASIQSLFADWSREDAERELNDKFAAFLADFDVDIFEHREVDVTKIFGLYFSQEKPFGESKKKYEFPDAFTLQYLEDWALDENDVVHVVSGDEDMRSGVNSFTNLVAHNSFPDLLSVLAFKYDELAPLCAQAFENAEDTINKSLSDQFANQGFVLGDQIGDVNEILDVEIQPYEPKLLRVDHSEGDDVVTCEFEIITKISFRAEISYDDLATASYDSEDKVLIPWNTIYEAVESADAVMAHVTLSFNCDDLSYVEIEELSLSSSDSVRVSSGEAENWHK